MLKKKHWITALKILLSGALVYFVFQKISLTEVVESLKKTHLLYLFLAFLLFILSKIASSVRLNLYFGNIGIHLTEKSNLALYWLGMFFNLFLPGGIGGDAYKGYLLNKKFNASGKNIAAALIVDRLSGMLLLYILAAIISLLIDNQMLIAYKSLITLSIPLAITGFYFFNKYLFKSTIQVFWPAFFYAALVQLLQLVCVWFIIKALAINVSILPYLLIFLISSVVAVLPLTIGGIGARELTFLYGAKLFLLDESVSVSISVLFFLITALVSLFGLVYLIKPPKLETTPPL